MELNNAQRADVLIQALPYIQKYYNKIIVVKYGGNAMINDELKEAVMGDIVLLSLIGIKVVLALPSQSAEKPPPGQQLFSPSPSKTDSHRVRLHKKENFAKLF